jgi:hypothetical protein
LTKKFQFFGEEWIGICQNGHVIKKHHSRDMPRGKYLSIEHKCILVAQIEAGA